ncbi:hypothetical protein DFH08DRAFT_963634 [Mycena albidolilacea]|uniref:Uncharacterized protein n=1 Tax=Mycena albidolilacea TaxID=1033008 RepID=A0AAD7EMR0_9AGAR|nr:hypothetical protein DFH08DRAFT_963634 [Mycena albidolilacea]
MAVEIAQAVATARLLHQFLLGQGLNDSVYPQKLSGVLWITSLINILLFREFSPFIVDVNGCTRFDAPSQLYRCYVIWGCEKKVTIFPTLLILSTFAVGNVAIYNPEAVLITYGLSAATNVILTFLTAGRILWVWRHAPRVRANEKLRGRYETAIKLILESGAIFSISSIFLLITFVGHHEMYVIGTAFALQLLNIIPTFTLVYVGMTNIIDPDHECGSHASSDPPNTPRMRTREGRHQSEVLDIKLQGEINDGQSE